MKVLLLAIALCLGFICGNADAQPALNTTGLWIQKPALPYDGAGGDSPAYGAGGGLVVLRDARSLVGGAGHVNTALSARCYVGSWATGMEWCGLYTLLNGGTGENVALYVQSQKESTAGLTFGQVVELNDPTGAATGAVAQEIDLMVNGPDTLKRLGIDIICGDARKARGGIPTLEVGCTSGLQIQPAANAPQAKWTWGVRIKGPVVVGLDTSDAVIDAAAIRIGAGQRIALEGTGQVTVRYETNEIIFALGGITLMRLSTLTGDLRVRGAVLPNTP